jgi:hypothetical protein
MKNRTKNELSEKYCPIASMQSGTNVICKPNCALYHPDENGHACFFQILANNSRSNNQKDGAD